jgi:hypothetical protein
MPANSLEEPSSTPGVSGSLMTTTQSERGAPCESVAERRGRIRLKPGRECDGPADVASTMAPDGLTDTSCSVLTRHRLLSTRGSELRLRLLVAEHHGWDSTSSAAPVTAQIASGQLNGRMMTPRGDRRNDPGQSARIGRTPRKGTTLIGKATPDKRQTSSPWGHLRPSGYPDLDGRATSGSGNTRWLQ